MDIRECTKESSIKRIVIGRIPKDADLMSGLKDVCEAHGIKHGYISSIIGSLKHGRFIYAVDSEGSKLGIKYCDPVQVNGPLEILSGQGFIGLDASGDLSVHLHMLLSDKYMRVFGGHFIDGGNDILATAEIVIHEVDNAENHRIFDESTGFCLFKVR